MALIRYVSSEAGKQYFAIVADDTKAQYVWPMEDEEDAWFEGDERIQMLLDFETEAPPTTAAEWIELASRHLGEVYFQDFNSPDIKTATAVALRQLINVNAPTATAGYSPQAGSAAAAWNEVMQDYPELGESDEEGNDLSPEGTLHWVLQTLGPIDPQGPNGWILRAADGNPAPGDEKSYIHWDLPQYAPPEPVTTEVPSE